MKLQTNPQDWAAGERTLAGYKAGALSHSYRGTLFAAQQVMQSAERIYAVIHSDDPRMDVVVVDDVGGHAAWAKQ